ncbi:hypothetical protein DSLASN_37650 [Desulfoluna limicola]|uniref:Uncharacterized protein n=1 Tax=Desulfoluna limicola TaxID=2810562 RepID=A0ABM7PKQ7_9BACT|nr:hypothetical protein DSLASN_37650 [Desulfoluna limicola]
MWVDPGGDLLFKGEAPCCSEAFFAPSGKRGVTGGAMRGPLFLGRWRCGDAGELFFKGPPSAGAEP